MPASNLMIGIGAGAASALLFVAAASGSPLALALIYVAPLPILLAGVGWRHTAGLIGTIVGAIALGLVAGPKTGLYFAIAVGLPSWWLAYLALLARPGDQTGETEWYPVGRLVIWSAVIGAGLIAISVPLIATDLDAYREALRDMFSKALSGGAAEGAPQLPQGQDPKALIDLMVKIAPGLAASFWTASSIFNLWLAGRITRASGRLARPWPNLPRVTFPPLAPSGLALGFLGTMLPGLPSLIAELFVGTFLIAFMLLGLAVLHVTTQAVPSRFFILSTTYLLLLLQPWVAVILALLGLAEQLFGVRRRFGPPPGGPPTAPANLP